jgi:hypothetical protein
MAYSSLLELETQYMLSIDLGYAKQSGTIEGLLKEIGGMLYRIMNPKQLTKQNYTLNPTP